MHDESLLWQTRRHFFGQCALGVGSMALTSLLAREANATPQAAAAAVNPLAPKKPHHEARAKSVIYLFMAGGPSQLELFEPKAKLQELDGQVIPESFVANKRFAFIKGDAKLQGTKRKFAQHGDSGQTISECLPHLAKVADDICTLRAVKTDVFNHGPAKVFFNTGSPLFGRPAMGSWITYGLGSESKNLPGYVVLTAGRGSSGGATLWQSGFLPSVYSGVLFRNQGEAVLNLKTPPGIPGALQRKGLDVLGRVNQEHFERVRDPEIASRIASYELAFRMQSAAPELIDLSGETQATIDAYGLERHEPDLKGTRIGGPGSYRTFASNCLLARRLVERGVRFVNIIHASWDHHSDLDIELPFNAQMADQPIAALIKDLKMRGLLDETLVVWASEFGRTPLGENRNGSEMVTGRDHHPFAFSIFLAGGGIQGGQVYGETDEIGWAPVKDPVHVNDLQATLLHLFGLDHLRLTHRFQGRDFRLTDVHGRLVRQLLA